PGPAVVRARPRRDVFGRVSAPARVWMTPEEAPRPPPSPADACLPVPARWLARLRAGERVRLTDERDARRVLTVADVTDRGCWAEATRTTYLVPGTVLRHERAAAKGSDREAPVRGLPPAENAIPLGRGDLLVLTRDLRPGRPATSDNAGQILTPATIGCTIPEAFDDVQSGEAVWFDDGKIGGVVEKVEASRV